MADRGAVADGQFCRDADGTQHGGRQRGIVKADSFFCGKGLVDIGQIISGNGGCLLIVIGDIGCDIFVDSSEGLHIGSKTGSQLSGQRNGLAVLTEIYILVGIKKRKKIICQFHVDHLAEKGGILIF